MESRKTKIGILFFSQVIILIILLVTENIFYIVHDDTIMVDIVSGGYGEVSEYLINMHIWIGYILKGLFSVFPIVNWVSVMYLLFYLISFFVLDVIFSDRERYVLTLVVLDAVFVILVSHFTFTVVAYATIFAGVFAMIKGMDREKLLNTYTVSGLLLVFFGCLIRGEAMKAVLIAICFFVLFDWKHWKKYAGMIVVCFFIMFFCIHSNLLLEQSNPLQKEFRDWGETRSSTLDCAPIPYDETVFNEKGISIAQYKFLYQVFYFDYEAISKDTLLNLATMNTVRNKYNFDIIGYWLSIIHSVNRENLFLFSNLHIIIFYLLLFYYMFLCIRKKSLEEWKGVIIWFGCMAVGFVFFFIQRGLYRVIMPNYIFWILVLLYMISSITSDKKGINRKRWDVVFAVTAICGFMWVRFCNYDLIPTWIPSEAYSDERQYVLEYMTDTNDKLYLAGDPGTYWVAIARPIFEYTAQKGNWTLMGDWEIYSVPYYTLMKDYNIEQPDNLLLESVNSPNVRYITAMGDGFLDYNAYVLDYVEEKYGIRPYFVKEEDIVKENSGIQWSVYSLKCD